MGWLQRLLGRGGESPAEDDYARRLANEQAFYKEVAQVHDLPAIFHYWSNQYLLPMFQPHGFNSPDDFLYQYSRRHLQARRRAGAEGTLHLVSIGSGNCDVEVGIARQLADDGLKDFVIHCLDINQDMLERGRVMAEQQGVAQHIAPLRGDFNQWQPQQQFDVVLANQSLHHVLELEHLFDAIQKSLRDDGVLLVSDMIGRNGHQRWPEALAALEPFWQELPEAYRYNQLMQRAEPEYINHDCSDSGFEGIRAQDILPLLRERFDFRLFIPFANLVMVFIDRPFGHNFDADAAWDRDFIDRVHAADEAGMRSGGLTPTQMVAVLGKRGSLKEGEPVLRDEKLTPEFCTRVP